MNWWFGYILCWPCIPPFSTGDFSLWLVESQDAELRIWRADYGTWASSDFGICGGSWIQVTHVDTEGQIYTEKSVARSLKFLLLFLKNFLLFVFVFNKIISSIFWPERSASDWEINFHLFSCKDLGDLMDLSFWTVRQFLTWKAESSITSLKF